LSKICSIGSVFYTLFLAILHHKNKPPSPTNFQEKVLSFVSSLCSVGMVLISVVCVMFNYLHDFCHVMASIELLMYVLALFSMKFRHLVKIWIVDTMPGVPRIQRLKIKNYLRFVAGWLALCLIGCAYIVTAQIHAECVADHHEHLGCHAHFSRHSIYTAMGMISFDTVHFAMFSSHLIKVVRNLTLSKLNRAHKIPRDFVQRFSVQFVCVVVAMISCLANGVTNLVFDKEFNSLPVFILDYCIIATCNYVIVNFKPIPTCACPTCTCLILRLRDMNRPTNHEVQLAAAVASMLTAPVKTRVKTNADAGVVIENVNVQTETVPTVANTTIDINNKSGISGSAPETVQELSVEKLSVEKLSVEKLSVVDLAVEDLAVKKLSGEDLAVEELAVVAEVTRVSEEKTKNTSKEDQAAKTMDTEEQI